MKIVDIENGPTFENELKQLEGLGFDKKKKNFKLLRATKGDVETVTNFLLSHRALKLKAKQVKREEKMVKIEKKSAKKLEKKWKGKKNNDNEKEKRRNGNRNRNYKKRDTEEELVSVVHLDSKESWPTAVGRLYLDGNNMLYVLSPIRSLVLKGKSADAEAALEALARKFAEALKLECTLIFDDTKRSVKEEHFVVCGARPSFSTSDDALVEWSKGIDKPSLFVTSDRELLFRLKMVGEHVLLCKPKEWFRYVARVLSDTNKEVEDLDAWMAEWINKNMKMNVENVAKNMSDLNL